MKKLLLMICSLSLLGLTACKETVKTKNGQIPAEYLDEAKAYTGSFTGMFNGERTHMKLSLHGAKAKLSIDMNSGGPLARNCYTGNNRSKATMVIGDLQYLTVDSDSDAKVYELGFKLNHNCRNLAGRRIMLLPSQDLNSYNIYITKRTWVSEQCHRGEFKRRPGSRHIANSSELFDDELAFDRDRRRGPRRGPDRGRRDRRRDRGKKYPYPGDRHRDRIYYTCYSYLKGNVSR